jgi:hypothetical protein
MAFMLTKVFGHDARCSKERERNAYRWRYDYVAKHQQMVTTAERVRVHFARAQIDFVVICHGLPTAAAIHDHNREVLDTGRFAIQNFAFAMQVGARAA